MAVWKLIHEAELREIRLFVHRGTVYFESPRTAEAAAMLGKLEDQFDEVRRELLEKCGADCAVLIELWKGDLGLRAQFPNIADFDDFAHVEGLRILRRAISKEQMNE